MPELGPRSDLTELLARWTAEGLIDAGQATRIAAAVAARAESSDAPLHADQQVSGEPPFGGSARRSPIVVEALGYLGGTLALVAGLALIPLLWPNIPTAAQLTVAAVAAVALWAAGALLRIGDEPAFGRLRSVLWLLSVASLAAFFGIFSAQIWKLDATSATLVGSAASTGYAVPLWWYNRSALQHLTTYLAAAVTVGTVVAHLVPGTDPWGAGLAVWGLSLLWGAAAHRGYLLPLAAGYAAAATGLLVGAQMTMDTAAGHVLALATVAGLLGAGVALRRILLLGFGAAGVIVIVPQTATRYLPTSAGAPLAVFVVGLTLLALTVWLAKTRKRPPSP